MTKTKVAIAGGGLAGLTCAKYLADQGCSVEIFEGEPFLGGRASTYRDADHDWIEQGLHLFLGTYSEFKRLLREIDQEPNDILFWMPEIRFQDTEGPQAVFGINPFHSPVQTVLSLLGHNDYLGPIDKLSLIPLLTPSLWGQETLRETYDHETVKDLWARLNGNKTVLERFLRPFCRGIQFSEPEQFSAYTFLGLVHNVLLDFPHALAGGYRGAREEIIFKPLAKYLRKHGAKIHTETKLRKIEYHGKEHHPEDGKVTGFLLDDGKRVEADIYVVAIPVWEFKPLIPSKLLHTDFFSDLATLPVSPAISVQVWFEQKLMTSPIFTLVANSRACVYQDLSTNAYPHHGSRISVIVTPADDLLHQSDHAILKMVLDSLSKADSSFIGGKVTKSVVLKHKHHLVRPLPGAMSRRPSQKTPVPNLFLAGDWTQQSYYGSQEGAVRGGKACAHQITQFIEKSQIGTVSQKVKVGAEAEL